MTEKHLIKVIKNNSQDDPMESNNTNNIGALKQLADIFLQRVKASKNNPPGTEKIHDVPAIKLIE